MSRNGSRTHSCAPTRNGRSAVGRGHAYVGSHAGHSRIATGRMPGEPPPGRRWWTVTAAALRRTGVGKAVSFYRSFAFDLPVLITLSALGLLLGFPAVQLWTLFTHREVPGCFTAYLACSPPVRCSPRPVSRRVGSLAGRLRRRGRFAWALGSLASSVSVAIYLVGRTAGLPGLGERSLTSARTDSASRRNQDPWQGRARIGSGHAGLPLAPSSRLDRRRTVCSSGSGQGSRTSNARGCSWTSNARGCS